MGNVPTLARINIRRAKTILAAVELLVSCRKVQHLKEIGKQEKKNKIVSHPLRTQRKKHVVRNASQYITTADISHKYRRYAANNKRKRKLSHLDGLHASADARKFQTNKKRLINGIKIDSSND